MKEGPISTRMKLTELFAQVALRFDFKRLVVLSHVSLGSPHLPVTACVCTYDAFL